MKYISIDGDDVGRKITSYYLKNNTDGLQSYSKNLIAKINNISNYLESRNFKILFCAADGILASTNDKQDYIKLFNEFKQFSSLEITVSAGVGSNIREAYIALLTAKSNGKNCLYEYEDTFH